MSIWFKRFRWGGRGTSCPLWLSGVFGFFAVAGCGSDAPTKPPSPPPSPFQQVTFSYIKGSELDAYLRALARILPDFYFIVEEQTTLFDDWANGRTNTYWTRVFANNLVLRIQAYSRNLVVIRPANAELKQLHDQLLEAMRMLEGGIIDFSAAIDPLDDTIIAQANEKIRQSNVALLRYTTQLSSLAGQPISFLPPQ